MSLTAGTPLGHYEIVGLIGAGGMGTVYRARDTRLGRIVAIKLVEDLSASDLTRTRLLREAQHASALNHPNICTIHEIAEAGGRSFIVMEYVEGRPLSEVTPQDGLPVERVIGLGLQIAGAIGHAHDHGILHRDLKPPNVVVTPDGRAKVLDFGIATRDWHDDIGRSTSTALPRSDTMAGTIAYMAPEVLQGQPAGVTSDIWALGAMLYEMATGRRPFSGRTEAGLITEILRDPPPPLPAPIPAGLAAVVLHCLAKAPEERYQRASEVAAALDACTAATAAVPRPAPRVGRVAVPIALAAAMALVAYLVMMKGPAPGVKSVAVLPFLNVGSNPANEYLSDGMTESIINSLAQLPQTQLKVIALNSVLRYKGREVDPREIGRDLAVESIVVGRIVRRPELLSVTTELVDAGDRSRVWGATYNMGTTDVLRMPQDIATQISDNLRLRLNPDARQRLTKRYTDNVQAYDVYLKGRYLWNKTTPADWTQAIDYYRQALVIDPGYALAWAGIADAYYQLSSVELLPAEAMPKARAAALKALELDDSLAEAHAVLGVVKTQYDRDRAGGGKELRRAIELNPNYATAHLWLGVSWFLDGQHHEALSELRRAQELDPLSPMIAGLAIWPLSPLDRHDEAIEQLRRAVHLHPDSAELSAYHHQLRGERYLRQGKFDEGVADLLEGSHVAILTGGGADAVASLKEAYGRSGIQGYWEKLLDLATARYHANLAARRQSPAQYVSPYTLAELNQRLGHTDRALALLEECYANRDENVLLIKPWSRVRPRSLMVDGPWWSLAADPRFMDLLRRLQ